MQALVVSSSRGWQYDQNHKQFSDLNVNYYFGHKSTCMVKTNKRQTKVWHQYKTASHYVKPELKKEKKILPDKLFYTNLQQNIS